MLKYSLTSYLQILAVSLLIIPAITIYTNLQANNCFSQKAVPACQQTIKSCTEDLDCQGQLGNYQDCSFGINQYQIFNGYCFRKWRQQAFFTKELIQCLANQCDLEYNSVIGLQELYQCTQNVVIDNFQDCDDQCTQALNQIRDNFIKQKIQDLFSKPLGNLIAQKLISKIKEICIQKQIPQKQQNIPINQTQRAKQEQKTDDKVQSNSRADEIQQQL